MELILCVCRRTYFSNCVSLFLMYFNAVVESLQNKILLTGILISWTIVLASLAAIKAASNWSLEIVNESLFIGVNLYFAKTKLQLALPLVIVFIYATAPYAFSDASANMCSSTGFVEKDLYHCPILTSFKSCMLCFQMFQRVRMSSGISSLQFILRFQSSCINNFSSRMATAIIPKGSYMLLVKPNHVLHLVPLCLLLLLLGHLHLGPKEPLKLFQVVFYLGQDLLVLVIKCYLEVTLKC